MNKGSARRSLHRDLAIRYRSGHGILPFSHSLILSECDSVARPVSDDLSHSQGQTEATQSDSLSIPVPPCRKALRREDDEAMWTRCLTLTRPASPSAFIPLFDRWMNYRCSLATTEWMRWSPSWRSRCVHLARADYSWTRRLSGTTRICSFVQCVSGRRMDGRMDGWMDGRMDGWVWGRMDVRMGGWFCCCSWFNFI